MQFAKYTQKSDDYGRIERAIHFIEDNFKSQPTLEQIADSVNLSKYHFDRLFKRWAGISPKKFLQFITLDYTKQKLGESRSLLETSLDAGLSGTSRLHDLFVSFEAMTPGEYKKKAVGLKISYGFNPTPFGDCLIATTERGICYLGFVEGDQSEKVLGELFQTYPGAEFSKGGKSLNAVTEEIFQMDEKEQAKPFNLHIKGTNFQINVWKALLTIPYGWVVTYGDIASFLGEPKASRAVGNAVAINPVAFLIPCHRVIAKSGKIHRYRWGATRKKAIFGWEAARCNQQGR